MKNRILILMAFVLVSSSSLLYGQNAQTEYESEVSVKEKNSVLSVGVLMGGGSLIGADFEFLIPKSRFGLQIGAGISSFGGGINYHLAEGINTQFVSLQYFHQGFGDNYYASWIGPMYVYRHKKLFQAGIGAGSLVEKGTQWYNKLSEDAQKVTASLLFNIGVYF